MTFIWHSAWISFFCVNMCMCWLCVCVCAPFHQLQSAKAQSGSPLSPGDGAADGADGTIDNQIIRRRRSVYTHNDDMAEFNEKLKDAADKTDDRSAQWSEVDVGKLRPVFGKDNPPPQTLVKAFLKSAYEKVRTQIDQGEKLLSLPRGGKYLNTTLGPIQFGIPPETIKDCMSLGLKLPRYYIVPRERFDRRAGISVSEFEFPTYFNFFVMRGRINLITNKEDEEVIRTVFQETLFGPSDANQLLEVESRNERAKVKKPNLQKELDYFRRNPFKPTEKMEIDTLINFIHFDSSGVATVSDEEGNELKITQTSIGYELEEKGELIAKFPDFVDVPNMVPTGTQDKLFKKFRIPRFGVTFMGTSHGFDPAGTTTGFVLWINRRGALVDPPPNTAAILRSEGIPAHLIDTVILTHCHADHDAGTFQKLVDEQRVTVVTTPTIMNSFLRKYAAMNGLDSSLLLKLFSYQPVSIEEDFKLHGATFRFFYTLHAIPCMAFEVELEGKRIVYSGDTCWEVGRINTMCDDGVLSEGRRDALINFPWDCDIVLHEAGVPPIHTPAATLAELDNDIKERLYCVHVSAKDFPFEKGLKIAACGVENTLRIELEDDGKDRRVLDLICGIDIFRSVGLEQATTIYSGYKRIKLPPGETLIKEGEPVDTFLVIESGIVTVQAGDNMRRYITMGDYFGERELITGVESEVTLTTATNVTVISFSRADFLCIVRSTDLYSQVMRVMESKLEDSYDIINKNSVFKRMSDKQKAQLQRTFTLRTFDVGATVFDPEVDEPGSCMLIKSGLLAFSGQTVEPFRAGTFIGDIHQVLGDPRPTPTGQMNVIEEAVVYWIRPDDMETFLLNNPGVLLNLINTQFSE